MLLPMTPVPGGTHAIAATDVSARRALPGPSATTSQGVNQLRQYKVVNAAASASTVFVRFLADNSGAAVVPAAPATAGDTPILPGAIEVFTAAATYIATICASGGTATVYVTAGDGA